MIYNICFALSGDLLFPSLVWLIQELDDRLLDRYSELLVDPSLKPTNLTYVFSHAILELSVEPTDVNPLAVVSPDPSFKTYLYDDKGKENSITLFEAQTTIEAGSTGLRTWTARCVMRPFVTGVC